MRVLMTGGGTAGHVNPALAIAAIIKSKESDSVIEYIGTESGIEGKLVPKSGMKLHPIAVKGLVRSLSPANLKVLFMAIKARNRCKRIIREFRPDVVIGTGGYVSWPVISAAAALGVPTVLHESNAEPGFAVKMLKKKADVILVNFEGTKDYLKGVKSLLEQVGMPVNKDFAKRMANVCKPHISALCAERNESEASETKSVKKILSFGGSLGAHTVNQAILRLMKEYIAKNPSVFIEHACGAREFESFKKEFDLAGLGSCQNILLNEYIYDMPQKMAEADLVICRSGASTLAELAVAGKAALLIPSPNVTGDQQNKNANQLLKKGAAVVLRDSDACDKIVDTVRELLEDEARINDLAEAVRSFAFVDCDERIYKAIKTLIN